MTVSEHARANAPTATEPADGPARWSRRRRVARVLVSPTGYLFAAPALVIFAVFTIAPTIYTFYISLYKWNSLNVARSQYIGFANYQELFQENDFTTSALNSLVFVVATVVGGVILSLLIALLLQRGGRWVAASRVAVFTPYVTPLVATSIAWIWLLNQRFGLFNLVLSWVGVSGPNWLLSSTWAMPAVIAYSLWHEVGFTVIVFLGGLSVLSPELNEAARVDGVNRWQEFWYVTWPQLRPVTVFVITITTIISLQAFTQFYAMTQGGPGLSTTTISVLLYTEVTTRTGYGAAIAVVLFAITVVMTLIQRRTSRPSALAM
ncbi:MAG TPA: sugar ABC transporter permease [Pseudonocardiaceae bacterium]|jgi:ABC-type sugar transport system permease subunit|nr:sugar ABC transporter permease [Pseudonocardiaceae bacterium]